MEEIIDTEFAEFFEAYDDGEGNHTERQSEKLS